MTANQLTDNFTQLTYAPLTKGARVLLAVTLTGAVLLSAVSCGPHTLHCPDGPRMEMHCGAAEVLREKVVGANLHVGNFGGGFDYASKLAGKATDKSFKMAMRLRALCDEYNSCAVTLADYRHQSKQIRGSLFRHVDLADKMQGGRLNPKELLEIMFEMARNLGLPVPRIPPGFPLPGNFPFPNKLFPFPRPPTPQG
jgi:hypothetical protein